MCKRECYYRAGLTAGYESKHGTDRICNYCTMTGRTRTAELVAAYKKKGRKLTDWERNRILTDEAHCPWHVPTGASAVQVAATDFFNSRSTLCEKTCKACGNVFAGGPRALYCPDCRDRAKREKQRAWWNREVEVECKDCGARVTGTRYMKYCPACRQKHQADGGRMSKGHRGRGPSRKKAGA